MNLSMFSNVLTRERKLIPVYPRPKFCYLLNKRINCNQACFGVYLFA